MDRLARDVPAWGISLVVNLSLLAVFHFIVLRQSVDPVIQAVTSIVDDTPIEEEWNFSETTDVQEVGNEGMAAALTTSLKSATAVGANDVPLEERIEEIVNPQLPQLAETSLVKLQSDVTRTVEIRGHSEDVPGGVEGAMDRVAYEIRQSLRERKTLVIWMFDASGSLAERRKRIADRFDNVYRQLSQTGTTDGLYSVIVSYGQGSELLTPEPLQDVSQLSEVVRKKIKTDESGIENVFGTIRQALEKFRNWRRNDGPWNKLVFIVTDERGDDAELHLEEAIALARRTQTRVYTIGNAAPFGRKEGYVKWVDPSDGYVAYLPVDQGPEGAFPEVVQLPFIGSGEDWRLRQMSSSYGPYALTRLCSETGGMYLITEDSRGHNFDRAVMRRYAPDYRPFRTLKQEIDRNPAKTALVRVAEFTYSDAEMPVPKLEFRGYNDTILRNDLNEAQRPVAEVDFVLKRMYDVLSAGESARGSLKEERWRASFDLAMGRILAMRVRYFGYNQMLANMKVNPQSFSKSNSNMWRLVPSSEIDTGPQMRKAAEQAREYLKRVLDEHPGTPWAMLAERELSAELGWSWKEFSRPIPGSDQLRANEQEVARLLLADEERRQTMRQQAEKPRTLPKL